MVARNHAVDDRALRLAAGEDEDDAEYRIESVTAELRDRWPSMSLADRKMALRLEIAMKWRTRMGRGWIERNSTVLRPASWPPARARGSKGRLLSARSRLVTLLEYENVLCLPARADGSPRWLSVQELTWISLLAGNWPDAAPAETAAGPEEVLRAERTLIKEARDRHGQKPAKWIWSKIPRGPRRRLDKK